MNPLYPTVRDALIRTLARNLRGAPSADEIPMIAEVMADDLAVFGYGADHADAVGDAVDNVSRTQDDWPTVRQVREAVRDSANRRRMDRPSLPAPEMSEERRKQHLENLAALRRKLRESQLPPYRSRRDPVERTDPQVLERVEAELDAREKPA